MSTLVRRLVESIRLHRRASLAVLVALFVAGIGLNLALRRAADDARIDLSQTRDRVASARVALATARGELTAARGDEASATAQRDELRQELTRLQQQLQATQQQLAATSQVVALQGPQIEALGRCLNGVSSALNQTSVADIGAIPTLQAAQLLCAEAQAALTGTPPG
jgi:chromosome segregation ATPase